MAKLSDAMIKGLRSVAKGADVVVPRRTLVALEARFMVTGSEESGYVITPTGRTLLDEHERTERQAQEQSERAARPVPAQIGEPSASTPLAWGGDYGEDGPEKSAHLDAERIKQLTGQPAVQSVRLTPAPEGVERESTDAELLQLLAMLDHGMQVSRALYQSFGVDEDPDGFALDPEKLDRAAREAVRVGLAQQSFHGRRYWLTAEPIHLDMGNGMTGCGIAQSCSTLRRRWTTDPAKVTHDRCK